MKALWKNLAINFIIFFLLIISNMTFAQPCNPGNDPDFEIDCNAHPECSECPIDGGLVALLVAGVGYGIKKVNDSRKKSSEPQ